MLYPRLLVCVSLSLLLKSRTECVSAPCCWAGVHFLILHCNPVCKMSRKIYDLYTVLGHKRKHHSNLFFSRASLWAHIQSNLPPVNREPKSAARPNISRRWELEIFEEVPMSFSRSKGRVLGSSPLSPKLSIDCCVTFFLVTS